MVNLVLSFCYVNALKIVDTAPKYFGRIRLKIDQFGSLPFENLIEPFNFSISCSILDSFNNKETTNK